MSIEQQTHLPPQNLDAEQSVLGAMLVSERALDPVLLEVRLEEEDFYRERHRLVFRMIRQLMDRNEAVDALTVGEALAANGLLEEAGGKSVVTELATSVPAAGNAEHYAKIVKANAQLRRLLTASQKIQQSVLGREGEPRDLVEQAEAALFKVARDDTSSEFHRLADILDSETKRLEKLAKGELERTGTPSGFRDLDDTLGGFQPGNLIILAARPSMGKSALVCNIAENVSLKTNKPVAFFSLEMSEAEIAHRFIANRAKFSGDKLRKGQVTERDWPRVLRACNELEEAPLWIDDSSDLSMLELRAKCRRLAASQGDLGLVIVDYIQLMRAEDSRAGRVEQVGQFSRGLKILARELEVPVIGLSQLSRAPEQRTENGRKGVPMLSDLRESGCLTGESRVLLPDEGGYVPIRDLVGKSGFRVLAIDTETWKLKPRRVTKAFSTGVKPVFKLRTALGKEIRATGNHKFLALDGWHRLDQLEVGARIALPRETPAPATPSEPMGDAHLALLGHLIGDGCTLPRHAIQYTSNERRLAELVGSLAISCFGDGVRPRVVRGARPQAGASMVPDLSCRDREARKGPSQSRRRVARRSRRLWPPVTRKASSGRSLRSIEQFGRSVPTPSLGDRRMHLAGGKEATAACLLRLGVTGTRARRPVVALATRNHRPCDHDQGLAWQAGLSGDDHGRTRSEEVSRSRRRSR